MTGPTNAGMDATSLKHPVDSSQNSQATPNLGQTGLGNDTSTRNSEALNSTKGGDHLFNTHLQPETPEVETGSKLPSNLPIENRPDAVISAHEQPDRSVGIDEIPVFVQGSATPAFETSENHENVTTENDGNDNLVDIHPDLQDTDTDFDNDSFTLAIDPNGGFDRDSAVSDLYNSSSMASVRSSIYNFIEENGRTYHQFKNGQYLLPNDEEEQNRLDLQHKIWDLMLKEKMYLAPIPAPQRVLDIGTGTGIWAMEFASYHPQAEVIGTDLSPIQPEYVPPNCRFEVDDAEDPWTFGQTFDFIHGRMLFAAFKNPARVIQQAYDALAPGGYLEMEEVYFKLASPDNSIKDTTFERWNEMLVEGAAVLGRDWHCTVKFKQFFIDAGFQDVVEIRQPGPIGPWPKNPDDKLIGLHWMANMLDGINAMSNIALRRGLGMSADEMEELLGEVRKDLRNRKIHSYWPIYVIYGRKPL